MKDTDLKSKKWSNQLQNFLVINLFILVFGAILFILSILAAFQGYALPLGFFKRLWYPIFIPSLSLFFTAVLTQTLWDWFQRKTANE